MLKPVALKLSYKLTILTEKRLKVKIFFIRNYKNKDIM